MEAMASGLPVIASKSGGIIDLIQDGSNGLLTKEKDSQDIADKINKLLSDQELCRRLTEEGAKTAAKYDYSEIGKQYAAIYDACLKQV